MGDKRPAWSNRKLAQGLCARCGVDPISPHSKRHCEVCLHEHAKYEKARQAAYLEHGLCIVCGARKDNPTKMCEKHRARHRERQRARYHARKAARGRSA